MSGDELRDYFRMRRSGALRTEEFHDAIEQSHIGYIHKYARRWGWIKYDYMNEPTDPA